MTASRTPTDEVEIRRAGPDDFAIVAELARTTWRAHFPGIITPAQIEYMLDRRYTPEALDRAVRDEELLFEVLRREGLPCAFAAHAATEEPDAWKLHQLYVLPDWQRHGLGGRLMAHVEHWALAHGRRRLLLTVNRRNLPAILAYQRRGFHIREEAVFDIGNGFVMDDFIMEKPLVMTPPGGADPRCMDRAGDASSAKG
ncbi:MAG: GNAT family N-acetyltransferase [Verrucomicrobiae bacterium]|nr:GNAT family N-acetyltransferase [Verrucomicrobiae bacterium]